MSSIDTKLPNSAWLHLIVAILLIVVTAGVYWQVHSFALLNNDDIKYVSLNPHITQGLTRDSLHWAFTTGYFSNWHPLTWVSYFADVELYGMNAGGFHSTNLQFHIMAVVLLFLALSRMTRAIWPSAMVAFLFAMHPLHVESVAWVSERKDVLSGFFMMLTLLAYSWYVEKPGVAKYALVLVGFAMGLMSKPMLVTLPCVLLLLDYWPLERLTLGNARVRVLEKIPLFALSIASSAVTYMVQEHGGAMDKFVALPLRYRVANAAIAFMTYLGKTFWPVHLAPFYPHSGEHVSWLAVVLCVLFLGAITVAAVMARRRHPYAIVGWLWFLGMLVPVIGLVQVGAQAMADRYTYLPLIGIFIAVIWLIQTWSDRWTHRVPVLFGGSAVLVVALCTLTSLQTAHWRDGVTLYRHAVAVTRNNPVAHNLLGNALALRGRPKEAIPEFERALLLDPEYPNAHFGLGIALQDLGQLADAEHHYRETLRLEPDQMRARYKLGEVLLRERKPADAEEVFRGVVAEEPRYMEAYNGLGAALAAQGKYQDAAEQYVKALDIRPDYIDALLNLAVSLVNMGQTERALKPLEDALHYAPQFAPVHLYLGLVYERLGDQDLARMYLREALRLDPSLAPARSALERLEATP